MASIVGGDRFAEPLKLSRQTLELSSCGRNFYAKLWKPIGRRSGIVVLFLHGGPFKGGPPSFPYGMRRVFLNLGYAVLEPEYSGDQEDVVLNQLSVKGYADIGTAVDQLHVSLRYLFQRFKKVLIYGESFGAYLGALANEQLRNPVHLVLYNPVMKTPRAFYMDDHPEGIIEIPANETLGDADKARAIKVASDRLVQSYFGDLLDRNLSAALLRSHAQTLLIYGGADKVTPRENVEAARATLRHVRFYLIPEAGHEGPEDQTWVGPLRTAIAAFVGG